MMCGGDKLPVDRAEPRDTFNLAYIIHFLLGAGNLLPWNAFITAVDYFGLLYPGKHVERAFSVAYMGSSLLALLVVMARKNPSKRARLTLGFSLFVLSLAAAPAIDWASPKMGSSGAAYGVAVSSVVVCGLADGLVGGTLMGSAGKLPKRYMQAVFAGSASSGVLVSVLRITTKALLPRNPKGLRASAHLYFLVSTMILMCCIVSCNLLHKLPVMEWHREIVLDDDRDSLHSGPRIQGVTRKIRWPGLGIFVIYVVTLSIFPGFIAENLESQLLKDWYPILLIAAYNVADLTGKSLTSVYVVESVIATIWSCFARLIFYPLFAACLHGPKWLRTEVLVVFLTFMLGLTNGYLTSVLMIRVPKTVPLPEAELAAIVMVVFLGLGLVGGSVIGWFWII